MDTSRIHLQTQTCMQNTSHRTGGLTEKIVKNHAKLGRIKELGGKIGVLIGLDQLLMGGEQKQGSDPHSGAKLSESEK